MTNFPPSNDADRRRALITARILCIAMLLGELIFLLIVLYVRERGQPSGDPDTGRMLFYVSGAMVVMGATMGFILRKATWGRRPVTPSKFITGHILFYAPLEAAAFAGIVAIMMGAPINPAIAVPVIAMAIQAISFPTIVPMEG